MKKFVVLVSVYILSLYVVNAQLKTTGNPGFFLEDWKPKKFKGSKSEKNFVASPQNTDVNVTVNYADTISKVSPYIFGNNSGIWMGRDALQDQEFVFKLKDIGLPVLRFPGGNLANHYFFDAASKAELPVGVPDSICKNFFENTSTPPKLARFGNWMFHPDSFYELLARTKSNGCICVNYSYALYSTLPTEEERVAQAAHYAAEWVREVNVKKKMNIKFWEVGNENWGQWQAGYYVYDRGFISPEDYGKHFRVFVDSMKAVDPTIKIGAVGFQKPKGSDPKGMMDKWNREVFPHVMDKADFINLHSYFTKYGKPASPEDMLNSIWHAKEHVEVVNSAIEDYTDYPANHLPIALTEFNTHSTATVAKKDGASNVSHTAGLFFAATLGELVRQGYGMAMMWDLYNGYAEGDDHGMFTSEQETDMPKLSPHPSFYHYYMYNKCFGDVLFQAESSSDSILVFPTTFSSGEAGVVIINRSAKASNVSIQTSGKELSDKMYFYEIYNEDPLARTTKINGEGTNKPAGSTEKYRSVPPRYSKASNGKFSIEAKPFSANYIIIDSKK